VLALSAGPAGMGEPVKRSIVLGGVAAALLVAAVQGPAGATARLTPADVAAVGISASLARPGATVTVSGSGCSAGTVTGVDVALLNAASTVVATASVAPAAITAGSWSTPLTVPAGSATGAYSVTATCNDVTPIVYTAAALSVDGTAPVTRMLWPPAPFLTSGDIPVRFTATDAGSGVLDYDLQATLATYRGAPSPWFDVDTDTPQTIGFLPTNPGFNACFRARAHDKAGNLGPWSAPKCTSTPVDDRSLTRSRGWKKTSSSTAYQRTLSTVSKKGATLTLKNVHARRLAVLVRECPTCGSFTLSLNGRKLGTYSTKSSRTRNRVLILAPRRSLAVGTVVITTTSKKTVAIDGLGVSQA
jgi:hypothetical protein